MKVTGNLLKTYFRNCSLENKKVYLEAQGDDALSEALASHFLEDGEEFMYRCITMYMEETENIGVTFSDFVLHLSDIRTTVHDLKQDKKRTEELLKKTKARMEGSG